MRIAHLQACVLEWPPRLHGDPQGSAPLQARHPRVVDDRMPLAQFGVRVDDLRVLHQPVAEVVDDGGAGEDAAQTFIKSRFGHDSVPLSTAAHLRPRSRAGGALHDANGTAPAAYAPPSSEFQCESPSGLVSIAWPRRAPAALQPLRDRQPSCLSSRVGSVRRVVDATHWLLYYRNHQVAPSRKQHINTDG